MEYCGSEVKEFRKRVGGGVSGGDEGEGRAANALHWSCCTDDNDKRFFFCQPSSSVKKCAINNFLWKLPKHVHKIDS